MGLEEEAKEGLVVSFNHNGRAVDIGMEPLESPHNSKELFLRS
jgi:hypothetical protein